MEDRNMKFMLLIYHDEATWEALTDSERQDIYGEYRELIEKDADVTSRLSTEEIARVFDLKHYLRNVDKVFARVFGD